MAIEIRSVQDIHVAVLSGVLDDAEGQELVSQVMQTVPRGGKLVVEGTGVTGMDQLGVLHLMTAQGRTATPERKRMPLAGFSPAIWQIIAHNGGDKVFDNKPTLSAALGILGFTSSPGPIESTTRPGSTPETATRRAPAPASSDEWQPPTAPSEGSTRRPVPPPESVDSAWDNYRPLSTSPPGHSKTGLSGKKVAIIGGCVLALVLGIGFWLILGQRAPELSISVSEISGEEGGKEVDEVVVEVRRGRLQESSWAGLPRDLFFEAPFEESPNPTYTLRGKVGNGERSASVQLVAESSDGTKKSAPTKFTVKVIEKPLSWQLTSLQSLKLKAGQPITAQSKFLTGTSSAPAASGLPEGVTVEVVPGSGKDWRLTGTPTTPKTYQVTFIARAGNSQEERSCSLVVETAPLPPPPPPPDPSRDDNPPPPPPPPGGVDDGMRRFLLERIEKLPSRYTDADRDQLREVVNGLTQARLIRRVRFEREGQKEVSADETAQLKAALQSTENKELLKTPGCQIIVVGYASMTGSMASNVRLSKARALTVESLIHGVLSRYADLCGDYGPTDVIDPTTEESNRAVEVYAGTMDISKELRPKAELFKQDFNRRHGGR